VLERSAVPGTQFPYTSSLTPYLDGSLVQAAEKNHDVAPDTAQCPVKAEFVMPGM
jgi:hypothetical protein